MIGDIGEGLEGGAHVDHTLCDLSNGMPKWQVTFKCIKEDKQQLLYIAAIVIYF